MRLELKTFVVCCAVVMMFLAANACDRKPSKPEELGFNMNSMKLADIQAGQELGETIFSADGWRVAFVAKKEGKAVVVLDSKMSRHYEDAGNLVFSPDGKDLAFIARKAGKQCVVVNGKEGKMYEGLGKPFFAPDGRIIYEAGQNGKWMMVAGNREGPVFDMPDAPPLVTPDGKRLVYIEKHYDTKTNNLRSCTIEMRDCIKGKDYDFLTAMRNDSSRSHLAYIAGKNGKMAVVTVDLAASGLMEKEGPWYDEVYSLDISQVGDHLAYPARRGEKYILVKDGVEMPSPEHAKPSHLVISQNGRAFNIGVLKGRFFATVDGKRIGKTYDEITWATFSPDGSQLAYVARKDKKWFVIVNGVEGSPFDIVVTPLFSPDGKRLIYRARQNGERFIVVADSQGRMVREHPHYEAVWSPVFSPDGKSIAYGVRTGDELWWKVEALK
jgi:WD40 repeat protein